MHFLLCYEYAEHAAEKRSAFREAHLALVQEYVDRRELLLGGGVAEPVAGAVILFDAENRDHVAGFALKDPYVTNGIVSVWRIREWRVVAGVLSRFYPSRSSIAAEYPEETDR